MLAPPPPMPLIMKPKPKRLMNVIHETRRPDSAPVFVRESLLDGQGLEATTVAYGKDGDMYINTTKDSAPSKEDLPKGVPAPAVSSDYRNPETNAEKADYRWVVNGKAPCSATCTTGLQSTYAQCQRKNGMVVEDANCDETKRPEPTHAVCFGKPCYARWVEGLWSQCSRSCGDGEQYRNVRCWQMMAPGFDSSVHDFLCDARRKPQYLRRCKERDCGPLWQVSEWTECSTKCGYGIQRREVRCSARQEDECVVGKKPAHEQRCYLGPCVNQWTVSEWSECSGPCGSGLRSRSVTCRDVNGNYLPSTQCDQGNRPIAVQACGDQPTCHPTWVPQEWGQCSADCGEGRANRKILCGAVVNNNFIVQPDAYCASKKRPVDEATCQAKPCEAQWFTTQWSKCSKTCGDNGVRVRTAKCYRKHSDSTAACDEKKKPATVEVCNMPPCEPLTPGGGCRDDKTANCALVLRVQLCDHWYYKKACCASCKADKRKNGS
ncbi:ADAMTS-like protein 2 [Lingula anatina]|uniref:ADAMTS-like protein 2 n=1 Tax=Lingula anatina TaxID=7574 RepID=A0A1S3K8H4_LINAN|nr:ADAMTS-like protein 2 [Lingula anatina]|eukprot:XP_013418556.1 ADAMTS-like protein 2 [Lingula anatina]